MSREAGASVARVEPSAVSPTSRVLVTLIMGAEHEPYLREGQRVSVVIPEPLPEQHEDPAQVVAMTFCDPEWSPADGVPDPCARHLALAKLALSQAGVHRG